MIGRVKLPARLRGLAVVLAAIFAVLGAAAVADAVDHSGPTVTVIGDSVADRLEHDPVALERLNDGYTLNLQTRGCRRLTRASCTIAGTDGPPPNVVQLARRLGPKLGRIVVVDVGYNDNPGTADNDFDNVMRTLKTHGVKRVVWLTLREARSTYRATNRNIQREPKEWPQLTVADWNRYSADHKDWFEADGLHLNNYGAKALATFIHRTLRTIT